MWMPCRVASVLSGCAQRAAGKGQVNRSARQGFRGGEHVVGRRHHSVDEAELERLVSLSGCSAEDARLINDSLGKRVHYDRASAAYQTQCEYYHSGSKTCSKVGSAPLQAWSGESCRGPSPVR